MTIQSNPLVVLQNPQPQPPSQTTNGSVSIGSISTEPLENLAGFDLIVNTTGPDTPSGIYPVVIDVSGTTYACTAHVWESNGDKIGLVAMNTDRPWYHVVQFMHTLPLHPKVSRMEDHAEYLLRI